MNKLMIIGNLTRDPETRTVSSGSTVCSFTVAVNRRRSSQNQNQPDADFFRVSAWNKLGEVCQRYLAKGRKVCVTGAVSVSSYEAREGGTRFSLDVFADDVEFLSPRSEDQSGGGSGYSSSNENASEDNSGFQEVDDDDLPF